MKRFLAIMATLIVVSAAYFIVIGFAMYGMQSDAFWLPLLGWACLVSAAVKWTVEIVK